MLELEAEVQEAATELGIAPGRISKWGQQQQGSGEKPAVGLSEEQKEIRRLQRELKEAQLERDRGPMLTHVCRSKKAVSIFSKGDGRYSDS
jgi:transposase